MTQNPVKTRPSIVIFGHDVRLVETRKWVLEKSGFRLFTVFNLVDLEQIAQQEQIDLFLLCDSLLARERSRALTLLIARFPRAKRLVLASTSFNTDLGPTETVFPAIEGPRKLVAMIHNLMTTGNVPPL